MVAEGKNSTKHNKNQHGGYTYWEKAWYTYLPKWRTVLQSIELISCTHLNMDGLT